MRGFHAHAGGAALALALGLAVFAGTAIAGNGNGNSGNGNGNQPAAATPAPAAAAPGNSGSAPGQQKQQAQPQPAAQSSAPGQQKKATSSSAQAGVKPSSTTAHSAHWTHCSTTTTALPAGCAGNGPKFDSSKRYGNGKTAAQIAISRGAPLDTKLTGPGNSQPHKVTACGKPSNKSGGVDVHAVKSYSANACAPKSAPAAQVVASSSQSNSTLQNTASSALFVASAVAPSAAASATPAASAAAAAPAATSAPSAGGVLGAQATIGSPAAKHSGSGGVLGTVGRVAGTQLPFTGLALWIVVLVAAALVTGGVLVRRHGRGTARI